MALEQFMYSSQCDKYWLSLVHTYRKINLIGSKQVLSMILSCILSCVKTESDVIVR